MILPELNIGNKPKITGIEFSIYTDEEIKEISVCSINHLTIYKKNIPCENAINDLRMGTSDPKFKCSTCLGGMSTCAGHFGHIDLNWPCINAGFIDWTLKILRTVCFFCSRITLSDIQIIECVKNNKRVKNRFNTMYNIARSKKRCPHCNRQKPIYTKNSTNIDIRWSVDALAELSVHEKKLTKRFFSNYIIKDIFNQISDSDCEYMGFKLDKCRPVQFIQNKLIVAPPAVRPAVVSSTNMRSRGQDDLTIKYQEILKKNISISQYYKNNRPYDHIMDETCPPALIELAQKLQVEVYTLINNNVKGNKPATQRSGVPLKTLKDRLSHKEGRIRGNLMGKRVDFSARSVISPDSNLKVDEVGVPEAIAIQMTVPETISKFNINLLRQSIIIGPKKKNGAETYVSPSGRTFDLNYCRERQLLSIEIGGTVERYLRDGDIIVFNRQPSLHKMGMMGHYVKIMQGNTFRLNLCTVNAYNADFDGDEMNMHVPQSIPTRIEVSQIMMVANNIISPKSNKPVIGIVQDSLIASWLLTLGDKFIDKATFMDLMCCMTDVQKLKLPIPAICFPNELWTGSQLFSLLLPDNLQFRRGNIGAYIDKDDIYDTTCQIYDGELLAGSINKSLVGPTSGGIIQILYNDYGAERTLQFMNDLQKVTNLWISGYGFSVGISDCIVPEIIKSKVDETISTAITQVESIYNMVNKSEVDSVDNIVSMKLSKILLQSGKIVQDSLKENGSLNRIIAMITSGSKGNPINISQISGCVGQNCVDGKRIKSCENTLRTLPNFHPDTTDVRNNGFVKNCYSNGLDAREFFLHAAGGREGLVDTAVKTALTGYMQRKIMKGQESIQISHVFTVVDDKKIIDFSYGGDNMDACHLEKVDISDLFMDKSDIISKINKNDFVLNEILRIRSIFLEWMFSSINNDVKTKWLMAENFERLYLQCRRFSTSDKMSMQTYSNTVRFMCQKLDTTVIYPYNIMYKAIFFMNFHYDKIKYIDITQLRELLRKSLSKISNAKICPGEMVGSISAQSISEPLTQMTLNTFHFAGVSTKNVTLGIPRFKELVEISKKMKKPSLTIFTKDDTSANLLDIIQVSLSDVIISSIVISWVDIISNSTEYKMVLLNELLFGKTLRNNMYIRLRIDKKKLKLAGLVLQNIQDILQAKFVNLLIISSTQFCTDWIIMICFPKKFKENDIQQIQSICNKIKLSGVDGISGASFREITVHEYSGKLDNIVSKKINVVDTIGSNLSSMSSIRWVDLKRTYTNDVYEIYQLLGVEAAAMMLYNELKNTISFDGSYVDPRHITLLVNTITSRGFLMPMSRHGINRVDIDPLIRSSFEETVEILQESAALSERDNFSGVTQSVMAGQLSHLGTGIVDMLRVQDKDKMDCFEDYSSLWNHKRKIDHINQKQETVEDFFFSQGNIDKAYHDDEARVNMFIPSSPDKKKFKAHK